MGMILDTIETTDFRHSQLQHCLSMNSASVRLKQYCRMYMLINVQVCNFVRDKQNISHT